MIQSNWKVIQNITSKIQSPLGEIRNRAITTLYTKVSAKIITDQDLINANQLPGVLFNWINETTPINKDCLYKTLSILHRYTFSQQGLKLLSQYEALQFLQEFRKFIMANETNVDQHVDIIKKIIKSLLPLENIRTKQQNQQNEHNEKQQTLRQQQVDDNEQQQDDQHIQKSKNKKNRKSQIIHGTRSQQQQQRQKKKNDRHLIEFYCLNDYLPKQIDEELYSLLIQLKHGKKQSVLETLIKIEEIILHWGYRYFGYKEELVRQLVIVIEGKTYSEVGCRILSLMLRQSLEMQQDIGISEENTHRNLFRITKLADKTLSKHFQKIYFQIQFSIYQNNPFTFSLLNTIIIKNNHLSTSLIQYLLIAVEKFPFSGTFLPSFLTKILNNSEWVNEKLNNEFYQEELMRMINHCCKIQPDIYSEVVPLLQKLFPGKSFDGISRKIPNLSLQLEEQEVQRSFKVLVGYSESKGNKSFKGEQFDFNLQLHLLQSHIKNLQAGIIGLPKKPEIISLYIDCLLMLAVSVAKQDSLMSFYPKIKSLILKISEHEYMNCRVMLFESILMAFNSSEKINYLAQSFLKSELIRLVFTDAEFYGVLLMKALNQLETVSVYLEITKVIQSTVKEQNRKYLNKFTPLFYILSFHTKEKTSTNNSDLSISSAGKILVSRTSKKYQMANILLSLFCKNIEERMKTYVQILGLSQSQDLLELCIKHINSLQKKPLKYSLSTIRNYMSIILNQKLQFSIKASAIEQMIECSQRIDLSLLQKDEELLKEMLSIRSAVQDFMKGFINDQSELSLDRHFFVQMVRIYSILEKRLRLQTNHLNQTAIKSLPPQLYLNILINLCTIQHEEQKILQQSEFKQVIAEFLMVVYYHVMTTFTSNLVFLQENQRSLQQKKRNTIITHWIVDVFPHQKLIQTNTQQIQSNSKRNDFLSTKGSIKHSTQKQTLINDFLKSYKLNIKSLKELCSIYIQNCAQMIPLNNETEKLRANILCPILQRQLSTTIHNLSSSHSEVSFFAFFIQSIGSTMSTKFFEPLQEIIPHLMNQLQKPNVPQFVNLMILRICNAIGWKRTKTFDSLIQQFDADDFFHIKLFNKLPKFGVEQLEKIIKTTLVQIDKPKNYEWICFLWQILLKPSSIKTLILSSTEYTQLLVFNSLIKCIQSNQGDQKLINYSIILLHQLLNEIYFEARKIPLQNLQNQTGFGEDKEENKIIEILKLVSSLSIGPSLIKCVLQQFENSDHVQNFSFTLQSLCFLLEALKSALNVQNFCEQNELNTEINISHEIKIVKMFVISLNEYIRANSELLSLSSSSMLFSSILNFINSLLKNRTFYQSADQIDLLDFSMTLFNEKSKVLGKQIESCNINKRRSQCYLLFCSILEHCYLRVQQNSKQNAHYLLSSTNFLQASFQTMIHLKNHLTKYEPNEKSKAYLNELLQILGKVLHSISLNQEDYFIFKLNHVCQQFSQSNLLQSFACLIQYGNENFLIFFMRFVIIWQGKTTQGQKHNQQKKTQFQLLNPADIFEDEEEDDSSIEERQLFSKDQKQKSPYENNWIYKLVDLAVHRGHIRYCKSLISLSLPAKMFLIEKTGFTQYLKQMVNLIDSKIIYESTTKGKRNTKKSNLTGNQSVLLSSSRNALISQNLSSYNQENQMKNQSQENKLNEIEDFMKFLTALFAVHEDLHQSQKQEFYVSYFINNLNRHKDILRKLFYSVDKLYTLSELITGGNLSKEFGKSFLKMINALSESITFSQSLSNHLTEGTFVFMKVTSPMLEESISTILKGISQPINQQDSQKLKQSLKLLSTLSNHESVRSYIYKSKLVEELNSRIIRYEQKKTDKSDFLNLNTLYDIVGFYSSLSKYKDSHNKILVINFYQTKNDKKVLEVLINQVYMQKSDLISEKILELLSNLSAYKLNKAIFMQNRQIHKTILGQLQSSQIEYKCHLLTLLYNLMYRHAPAVKLYKRKDVIQMIENNPWQKFDNWESIKHIHGAVLQVLKNQTQIPDKN